MSRVPNHVHDAALITNSLLFLVKSMHMCIRSWRDVWRWIWFVADPVAVGNQLIQIDPERSRSEPEAEIELCHI